MCLNQYAGDDIRPVRNNVFLGKLQSICIMLNLHKKQKQSYHGP